MSSYDEDEYSSVDEEVRTVAISPCELSEPSSPHRIDLFV